MDNTLALLDDGSDVEERITLKERIVLWLLKHPFQRAEDVALVFARHRSSVYRHLMDLEAQGLVEHLTPSCDTTRTYQVFYLTTKGVSLAAALVGAVPAKLARMWGADENHLLARLPRLQSLIDLHIVIHRLIKQAPSVLAYPAGQVTSIRWHWVGEYRHTFISRGRSVRCRIDAALVLARHQQATPHEREYYVAFLIVDPGLRGNNDLDVIRDRLKRLLQFRESAERWSHYRSFPALLVLVPSVRSREVWQRCAREVAAHLRLAPLQGAIVVLPVDLDHAGSIWSLPWQHLSVPGPCRLQTLLVPVSRESVPVGLLAPKPAPAGTFRAEPTQEQAIVRGQFAQRAQAIIEQRPDPKMSTEPATVALLGVRLHRHLLVILLMIYAHPLLNRTDVSILLRLERMSVKRYLYELRTLACIEERATAYGNRLLLSERGLRLVAMVLGVSFAHVCESGQDKEREVRQRGVAHLLARLQHTVGIYHFVTLLESTAQSHGHRLLWWETGARCARRYRYQGRWHNLLPDAAFAYRTEDGQVIRAWLEWDEGTMNSRDLAAKLHAYREFVQSRQWFKEEPRLPLLIFVVSEPRQEWRIRMLARGILQATALVIRTTTTSELKERGLLTSIWLPVLPVYEGAVRTTWLNTEREGKTNE